MPKGCNTVCNWGDADRGTRSGVRVSAEVCGGVGNGAGVGVDAGIGIGIGAVGPMWAREWGLEPAGKSGLESARGVVVLEYRVSVKVSWEFAKLLECPGRETLRSADIVGVCGGSSQNCTGVILDVGVSRLEFSIPTLLVRGGTVRQPLGIRHSFGPTGPRHSVSKRRNLEQWLKNPLQNTHFQYRTV